MPLHHIGRYFLRVRGHGTTYANRDVSYGDTQWDFDGQEIFKRAVRGMGEVAQRLDITGPGHAILGTVPPQHMFGFESTVLLPLLAGAALTWAGVVLVWGANFAVQKALFGLLPPGAFLFARYLLMPVAGALLLLHANGWRWPRLPRRDLVQLAWLGILGHTLHVSMVTFGIHWSTAFSSALIMACSPVFTLLILHWAGIEALSRGQVAGVALACAGVLIFLSDKLLGGNRA